MYIFDFDSFFSRMMETYTYNIYNRIVVRMKKLFSAFNIKILIPFTQFLNKI